MYGSWIVCHRDYVQIVMWEVTWYWTQTRHPLYVVQTVRLSLTIWSDQLKLCRVCNGAGVGRSLIFSDIWPNLLEYYLFKSLQNPSVRSHTTTLRELLIYRRPNNVMSWEVARVFNCVVILVAYIASTTYTGRYEKCAIM